MSTPTMTDAGLQQTGGSDQTITTAGMAQWIANVNGFRRSAGGKRQLFTSSREELIRTSRRDTE